MEASPVSNGQPYGLALQVVDAMATLTLDRPAVLNALDGALIDSLMVALDTVRRDDDIRVLILTGKGRAFCAGADLRDPMMGLDLPAAERGRRFMASSDRGINALARALDTLGKPRVAAVNGAAVGGGMALALCADIVLMARSAYFQMPFTSQLGLVPDMGASWHLMRRAGPTRAIAAAMLGERIAGPQAAEWGLVWQCVEDGELLAAAEAVARKLGAGAPRALKALPAMMWRAFDHGLDAQLEVERELQARQVQTDDFMEGVKAFQEKRKPRFTGQ
ncbi:enoyl-CoA hydratase/isomerase family protein [Variovorax sp. PBL-E5]|uniref:enoyl-CoA hydratase/isomerase family protein n=1 Tax=Variovorax sp. PBL-E5 TaxID=434014 RepID=UPI0013184B99|nr:enoyl-CoA hydratase-related protein [Variovorax sp. PBL-E5]VTU45147.1 1,2-epoxyphenylacetyl-CoA isomerase [Variovorax sp. PBL-E5]